MDTKVITAHIPLDLAEKVDRYAEQNERSRGWVVKQALAWWIAREDGRNRLTQEVLDDFRAGKTIADEDVRRWIESLATDDPLPAPKSSR